LAVFGAGFRHFGNFAIFSKLTPILVEFVEEKKEKTVFAITLATGNLSGRFLGRFWVSSTFWSHWSRFQSHWRSFAGVFSSGKLSGPPGPFQCWSCLEAMLSHFWWFKSHVQLISTLWIWWQRFQNQLRPSSHPNSPLKIKGPPGPFWGKYC